MSDLKNYVSLVLDRSGSMSNIKNDVVDSFNAVVQRIRDRAEDQDTRVSFYTFADNVREEFFDRAPTSLPRLTGSDYRPNGQTSLLDAIGDAITALSAQRDAKNSNVSFLVIVLTDGYENNSDRFSQERLRALIADKQNTDRWTFVFQVPPGSTSRFVEAYGVPRGNVREWEATSSGTIETTSRTLSGIDSYYGARSMGMKSVQSFYVQPNLANLSPAKVKRTLTDISRQFDKLSVREPAVIKEFVEERTSRVYQTGSAYYQLTKSEKVQAGKQLLLQERGKSAVWGGHEARELIGLPVGVAAEVIPGNHANYDIFVQSTSVNRKLVPGTSLLVQR